ncbi:MAG: hypothetical protein PHR39_09615, partial [Actinomycetota bacterium]|nr:hypothetical protein [Actinomycetota bacterium]
MQINISKGKKIIEEFCGLFPDRIAGSLNENLAAEWIAGKLKEIGIENVQIEQFPVIGWHCNKVDVVLVDKPELVIHCIAMPYTRSSNITSKIKLFDPLNPGKDIKGKIALINWNGDDITENKIQYISALEYGAVAT